MEKKDIKTIKQFALVFREIEEKNDLLEFDVDGIKLWQYLRFRIYLSLSKQLGIFENAHTKKVGFIDVLSATPSLLKYSIISNPLAGNYKRDILIFNSGRKVKVDGKLIDIYSDYLISELQSSNYEIIEELYLNKHLIKEQKNRKYQDYQVVRTRIKSKLSQFKFNINVQNSVEFIKQCIKENTGVNLNLQKLFLSAYKTFKYDFEFYDKLIKKRNPNKIYLVCSYGYKMALIAAARQNGVETIELQHGTMSKYNMGYSYPDISKVNYFPDKIHFFGEYWKNLLDLPLKEKNKIVTGFKHFQQQKEAFKKLKKQNNSLLILSQGTIGRKLAAFIWESKQDLKDFKISYKLHPGEYDRWEKEYPELVKISQLSNVEVICNNDKNLYEYLAISEFVIGVYSTAVIEALAFNCRVILANLSGIEYFEDLIEKGYVKLAKHPSQIESLLVKKGFNDFDPKDFFG